MTLSTLPSLAFLSDGWDDFVIFGFEVHVSVLLGCISLAAIYLMAVGPARRRFG